MSKHPIADLCTFRRMTQSENQTPEHWKKTTLQHYQVKSAIKDGILKTQDINDASHFGKNQFAALSSPEILKLINGEPNILLLIFKPWFGRTHLQALRSDKIRNLVSLCLLTIKNIVSKNVTEWHLSALVDDDIYNLIQCGTIIAMDILNKADFSFDDRNNITKLENIEQLESGQITVSAILSRPPSPNLLRSVEEPPLPEGKRLHQTAPSS
jgi:hypothetical protein